MRKALLRFLICFSIFICVSDSLRAQPTLGDAPHAPKDVSGLPSGGIHPSIVTGNFNVDTSSREQVREFYNAVYTSSAGVPIGSTADTANCTPGTNSTTFSEVTLRRINWFRAMAGIPAAVTLDFGEGAEDQQAAIIMSSNNKLQHVGDWTGWSCITGDGTNASGNSNLALGYDGPDAITGYIWDFGANNFEVGHRRWILYPQTQVMGTGDVPAQGTNLAANATWVFDSHIFDATRPATRTPYISWPPAGYVPYQIVYPQWSFALSNSYGSFSADLTNAIVTMTSNGVSVAVTKQPIEAGFGENTLVWYPSSLDPSSASAVFPFNGTDTVYHVTVSNIKFGSATVSYNYDVTVFDPETTGVDYFPLTISGPSQPAVGANNSYTTTAETNPNTTGYQWLVAQTTNGNLVDSAQNGLVNFTISPTPAYPVITNAPDGSGNCFHLTHLNPTPQLLQLNRLFFPSNDTMLSFKSWLDYATADETARVQVSSDGGNSWQDIFAESGRTDPTPTPKENGFTLRTFSLANYAGQQILLRFNFDFSSGNYYPADDPYIGWCIDDVTVTNMQQFLNFTTNSTVSTNFIFTPSQTGNYTLFARGIIFSEFPLDWGTARQVTAVTGATVITLGTPGVSGNQVQLGFNVIGSASTFKLLQADQVNGPWTTNTTANLTTIVAGSSYKFTTTSAAAARFYRIQSP